MPDSTHHTRLGADHWENFVLVVAGLSLKNLQPRVWDPASPYFLPDLRAVMVSYADFHRMPARKRAAIDLGLRAFLGVPTGIDIYLDNGAFYFLRRDGEVPFEEYDEFVLRARPDWYPIPRDFIPSPAMSLEEQQLCLHRTMQVNLAYRHNGYAPVIHAGTLLDKYIGAVLAHDEILSKPAIWLGGLVPQLLRSPSARPHLEIIDGLRRVRQVFADKHLHVFGVGGTATLHLAALINIDSVDSTGWRNRAARGIIQLPGSGDRMVAELGSWRGRVPSSNEWELLASCRCPACQSGGVLGLRASRLEGFCNRATHNLWTLLDEARQIQLRLSNGSYADWYPTHVSNSIYRPLIDAAVQMRELAVALPRTLLVYSPH